MDLYPDFAHPSIQFIIFLRACKTHTIIPPPIENTTYSIGAGNMMIPISDPYTLYKKCEYSLSYESFAYHIDNGTRGEQIALPDFVMFNSTP